MARLSAKRSRTAMSKKSVTCEGDITETHEMQLAYGSKEKPWMNLVLEEAHGRVNSRATDPIETVSWTGWETAGSEHITHQILALPSCFLVCLVPRLQGDNHEQCEDWLTSRQKCVKLWTKKPEVPHHWWPGWLVTSGRSLKPNIQWSNVWTSSWAASARVLQFSLGCCVALFFPLNLTGLGR